MVWVINAFGVILSPIYSAYLVLKIKEKTIFQVIKSKIIKLICLMFHSKDQEIKSSDDTDEKTKSLPALYRQFSGYIKSLGEIW